MARKRKPKWTMRVAGYEMTYVTVTYSLTREQYAAIEKVIDSDPERSGQTVADVIHEHTATGLAYWLVDLEYGNTEE